MSDGFGINRWDVASLQDFVEWASTNKDCANQYAIVKNGPCILRKKMMKKLMAMWCWFVGEKRVSNSEEMVIAVWVRTRFCHRLAL